MFGARIFLLGADVVCLLSTML